MRNAKGFKLVRKWRVSLKRTRVAEEGDMPSHRCRSAAFQTHGAMHEQPDTAKKYACISGDKAAASMSLSRGRSIAHELIDNARVFSELSHDVVRLIDEVENTASKLVPPPTADQSAQHLSPLASQVLKNAQRGAATCKHIDAVVSDCVDRIRQGMIVMEQAGVQHLHTRLLHHDHDPGRGDDGLHGKHAARRIPALRGPERGIRRQRPAATGSGLGRAGPEMLGAGVEAKSAGPALVRAG